MNLVLQNQDTRKCIWITNIQIKPRPNLIAVCIVLSCIYCLSFTVGYRNIKPKRKNSVKQSRLDMKIWRQLLNFLWRVYLLQRCTDCCYLLHRKTVSLQFWSFFCILCMFTCFMFIPIPLQKFVYKVSFHICCFKRYGHFSFFK